MLAGVLNSKIAIKISIEIIKAFVEMRKFISQNGELLFRMSNIENKQLIHDKKLEEVFNAIEEKDIKPQKGVFFEGEIFDSYVFVCNLIRSAEKSIIIIDNYVDDSILVMLNKRNEGVAAKILTKNVTNELRLDLKKHNSQNEVIRIEKFEDSHDRFLIIDEKEVYHFGASLKDLGKKWFAFSRFDNESLEILNKIKNKGDKK